MKERLITGILKQLNYLYTIERFSLKARKDIISLNKHLKELKKEEWDIQKKKQEILKMPNGFG